MTASTFVGIVSGHLWIILSGLLVIMIILVFIMLSSMVNRQVPRQVSNLSLHLVDSSANLKLFSSSQMFGQNHLFLE